MALASIVILGTDSSQVKVTLGPTASRPVSPGVKPHLGLSQYSLGTDLIENTASIRSIVACVSVFVEMCSSNRYHTMDNANMSQYVENQA
jgi:hypothetical protein